MRIAVALVAILFIFTIFAVPGHAAGYEAGKIVRERGISTQGGLYFDGADDYVEIANSQSLDVQNQTIVMYIMHEYTGGWQCFFNHKFYSVWLGSANDNDNIYLMLGNGSAWKINKKVYINWEGIHMLVLKVYSQANITYASIYLDTENIVNVSTSYFKFNYFNQPIRIFNQYYSNAYETKGSLFYFNLYNRSLSAYEINEMYNYLHNGTGSPLMNGSVLMLTPSGLNMKNSKWVDESGEGNNGTIYGATPIPAVPSNQSISISGNTVHLSWSASKYAKYYNVYRAVKTRAGENYTLLASTTRTHYDDTIEAGLNYTYYITAVNTVENNTTVESVHAVDLYAYIYSEGSGILSMGPDSPVLWIFVVAGAAALVMLSVEEKLGRRLK